MFLKRYFIGNIDFLFLFFLLFISQGNIQLKLLVLGIITLLRFNAVIKYTGFAKFYVLIILYHCLYGIINIVIVGKEYVFSFALALSFWGICYIIHTQLYYFINKSSVATINRTINIFFIICVGTIIYQYLDAMYAYKSLNPYEVTPAAGDKMKSIFSNSSVSMIIMSFFFLNYIFRRKVFYSLLAIISLLMATYMSGTVIFFSSILLGTFLFSRIKLLYKLSFLSLIFIFSVFFIAMSPKNVDYAMSYIYRIIENNQSDLPFKIKSFWQTFEYWLSSTKSFLLGSGGGNFSSRVAFIISGDYVNWYPKSLVYISPEFDQNHFSLWTFDFNNPWDNRNNTANQPFSFYNQIIGEYGVLGVLLFYFFYLKTILKQWKILTFSKFMLISLCGYFLLDYWYEYFSVIVIFELLFLYDVKLNQEPILN